MVMSLLLKKTVLKCLNVDVIFRGVSQTQIQAFSSRASKRVRNFNNKHDRNT